MKKKLSVWARENGVSYQTAWNMVKANKMPVRFERLATGTILVIEEEKCEMKFCPHCGGGLK